MDLVCRRICFIVSAAWRTAPTKLSFAEEGLGVPRESPLALALVETGLEGNAAVE